MNSNELVINFTKDEGRKVADALLYLMSSDIIHTHEKTDEGWQITLIEQPKPAMITIGKLHESDIEFAVRYDDLEDVRIKHPKHKWLAIDADGEICIYIEKPLWDGDIWYNGNDSTWEVIGDLVNRSLCDYAEQSLVEL